jgi:hypothetical protein
MLDEENELIRIAPVKATSRYLKKKNISTNDTDPTTTNKIACFASIS